MLIISIEDGIVMGIYSDIHDFIDVKIIDADDYYDDERKTEYLKMEALIESGALRNLL